MEASAITGRKQAEPDTDTHEIEGVGEIRFRGMSRWELHEAGKIGEAKGAAAQERFLLARCMVDPVMTEDDVRDWQSIPGSAGEIAPIQGKINKLSKIGRDAAKSDVQSDGAEPRN